MRLCAVISRRPLTSRPMLPGNHIRATAWYTLGGIPPRVSLAPRWPRPLAFSSLISPPLRPPGRLEPRHASGVCPGYGGGCRRVWEGLPQRAAHTAHHLGVSSNSRSS